MKRGAVLVLVAGLATSCKKEADRAGASPDKGLEGPCAAEREAAGQAWDRVGYDLSQMREGIIKETVSLELNEHMKLTHALVNSPECAGLIGLFDNLVAAKDKPRWEKCNADSQALNAEEDRMRRLMNDKAGLAAEQRAAAKEAHDLAARYRQGPVSEADVAPIHDRLLVYYRAASRVQSTGPQCLGNDCLSTPAAAMIAYDMSPAEIAMRAASAACPKVADTTATPPPPVNDPVDEEQGGEPCTPRLVLDPDRRGTGGNLRAAPNGDILLEVPNCTEVCEIEADGDWRKVRASPRDVGYIHRTQLAEMTASRCKARAPAAPAKPAKAAKPKPEAKPDPGGQDMF